MINDNDNQGGEEEEEAKKKEEKEGKDDNVCWRWGQNGVVMDNDNVDNNGNCFLDNGWYVIDDIDDDINDVDNEVDAQKNIIRGWIGAEPSAANDMWVLEILGGFKQ